MRAKKYIFLNSREIIVIKVKCSINRGLDFLVKSLMAHCSSPNAAFSALPTRGRPKTADCTFCTQTLKGVALQGSATSSIRRSHNKKTQHFLDWIHKRLQMQISPNKRNLRAVSCWRLLRTVVLYPDGSTAPPEGRRRRRGMGWDG